MLVQRLAYRQLLYLVVLCAAFMAVKGRQVGWGKLERTGNVGSVKSDSFVHRLPVKTEPKALLEAA